MPSLLSSILALSACLRPIVALGPWQHYQTEPHFRSSIFNISINTAPERLAPGYIWLTTYVSDFKVGSFGPQIYTMDGDLVWNGNDSAEVRAMDAHVCDYMGVKGKHICYNDAAPTEQAGHSAGVIRFFDDSYEQVGTDFGAAGNLRAPDIHELNVPEQDNGYSFLQDVFQIRPVDLTPYRGPKEGYVLDGCFQEIEMATKTVLFEWCFLDHMDVDYTYLYLHKVFKEGEDNEGQNFSLPIAGNGSWEAPWDFMHLNAVGKNLEGDYLLSGRHMDTILKIAGNTNTVNKNPGEVIWRLGGKHSDFEMDGFSFSRQHTARFLSTGKTITQISLFNNNYDGWAYKTDQMWSSGQLIELNNSTMKARLVHDYPMPDRKMSFSQGSMQMLPNGNAFMGWGNLAFVSEHTFDGTPIYYAYFSGEVESFRAWKFDWVGKPKTQPKTISYAYNATSPLYAYVSWNGATEIKSWNFYTSISTKQGPWHLAGSIRKSGFETFANFSAISSNSRPVLFSPYMYADALDTDGNIIGTSPVVDTFVPNTSSRRHCNESMCTENWFSYAPHNSDAHLINTRNHNTAIWVFVGLICAMELVQWVMGDFGWDMVYDVLHHGMNGAEAEQSGFGSTNGASRLRAGKRRCGLMGKGKMEMGETYRPDMKRFVSGPDPERKTRTMKASGLEV